jgi:hypothetical protein
MGKGLSPGWGGRAGNISGAPTRRRPSTTPPRSRQDPSHWGAFVWGPMPLSARAAASSARASAQRSAVRVEEDGTVRGLLHREAAFMDESVVPATREGEVLDRRRAAVRPVHDVMRVEPAAIRAAREAACRIADVEHATERAPDCSAPAPDIYAPRRPLLDGTLDEREDRRVAAEPADGLGADARAVR